MNTVKKIGIAIASIASLALVVFSGCTGKLETTGIDSDDVPTTERKQALLNACDGLQSGDACTVEIRGREVFSGTCVDVRGQARCVTDDAATGLGEAERKADEAKDRADAGINRADAGNVSADAGNVGADAGNVGANLGNVGADAGTNGADPGTNGADPGDNGADAGNSRADAGNAGNDRADKGDLDLTEVCDDKEDGDACTVEFDGRELYTGTCDFGFCLPD